MEPTEKEIKQAIKDNPDLPYSFVKNSLIAMSEAESDALTAYKRGSEKYNSALAELSD